MSIVISIIQSTNALSPKKREILIKHVRSLPLWQYLVLEKEAISDPKFFQESLLTSIDIANEESFNKR